ncbi:MAG TPA: hypothetical protein VNE18_01635 [Rhodanobacter sp.]|nr:hypothetical protein [Rhodanobacter sp.]
MRPANQKAVNNESKILHKMKAILYFIIRRRPNVPAMKKEQQAFAQRLVDALAAAGIEVSPAELERLLARYGGTPVTPQAISGWLTGKHLPKQANMRALAKMVGLEPYALQYGSQPARGVREVQVTWPAHVRGHDRLAFEEFLLLPERQRKLVRELIAALTDASQRKKGA